jgi:hypothetical protein
MHLFSAIKKLKQFKWYLRDSSKHFRYVRVCNILWSKIFEKFNLIVMDGELFVLQIDHIFLKIFIQTNETHDIIMQIINCQNIVNEKRLNLQINRPLQLLLELPRQLLEELPPIYLICNSAIIKHLKMNTGKTGWEAPTATFICGVSTISQRMRLAN